MKRASINFIVFISAIFSINLIFYGLCSAGQDRSEEINKYINLLDSKSSKDRINAAKMVVRSGLTDPRLFNVINARLLNIDRSRMTNSDYIDELSWYCKALASSGRSEYKETLDTVARIADDGKLENYAKQSLGLIDDYARRNALMSDTSKAPSGQSPEVTRYVNMLRSGDDSLIKEVAKVLYRTPSMDPAIFEAANEVLLEGYQKNISDTDHADTMAWVCKALGASGNPAYKATLEKVISDTSSPVLKNHASKSLGMLN